VLAQIPKYARITFFTFSFQHFLIGFAEIKVKKKNKTPSTLNEVFFSFSFSFF
jgi:hypothetical protein